MIATRDSRASCVTSQELLAYWLGELDEAQERVVEEHLFACAACAEQLSEVVALGTAIRGELLRGDFGFVLPLAFIRRIKAAGLRVREYELEPGGSVQCTVTPNDDLVVAHLHAPLRDVRRLDLLIEDDKIGRLRVTDVAFDPSVDGVAMVPSVEYLRTLRNERQRVRLVAVDGVHERVIGDYTFNHYAS
jgi:putative zinc finger protein